MRVASENAARRRAALVALMLVACHKETKSTAVDAGTDAAPARVPAPNSLLAQELGTDDAGRGTYRYFDDGPGCGPTPRIDRAHDNPHLGVALGSMQFYTALGPPPKVADEDARSPIQLKIKTKNGASIFVPGEKIPLTTTLVNRGKVPFTYQRAMDGSTAHWVSPFVDTYVKAKGNGVVARWTNDGTGGECGNINSRQPEDFITLKPGARRDDPFGEWARDNLEVSIWTPGTYTIWLVYASCQGPTIGVGLDDDVPIPDGMFEGNIASNGLTIEVGPTL